MLLPMARPFLTLLPLFVGAARLVLVLPCLWPTVRLFLVLP